MGTSHKKLGSYVVALTLGLCGLLEPSCHADDTLHVASSGKVGINTNSPSELLHVQGGNIRVASGSLYTSIDNNDINFNRSDGASAITQISGGSINLSINGVVREQLTSTTTSLAGEVDLSDNTNSTQCAAVISNGSHHLMCDPSALRFKEDIVDYDKGITQVMALRPVSVSWKSPTISPHRTAGLIAEEVEQVVPEVVVYSTDNTVYGLNYAHLVPLLIRASQDQQKEIVALKVRLGM